jgi:hypothetical protein
MLLGFLLFIIGLILFLVWPHVHIKSMFADFMIGAISILLMAGSVICLINLSCKGSSEEPEYEIHNVKSYRIEQRITITDDIPSDTVYTIYYKR